MSTAKTTKYFEGVGRRKEAVVRARITPAAKTTYTTNGLSLKDYFKVASFMDIATRPITIAKAGEHFTVSFKAKSGGVAAQADAAALGLARALIKFNTRLRADLKKAGLLSVDPRQKERRKFGLKKARKSPQWSKR